MRGRIICTAVAVLLLLLVVAARIVELTLTDSAHLAGLARRQHREQVLVAAQRGAIVDRHGETLAASVARPSIFAHPRQISAPGRLEPVLARALSMRPQTVATKLQRNAPFVWIKRAVTPRQRDDVMALKLVGVGEKMEARRYYPHGTAAAHVVGLAGVDLQGLEGIERYYERDLRALPRMLEVDRDAFGRAIFSEGTDEPHVLRGASVELTIDLALQDVAERALTRGVAWAGGQAGTALVLDPQTGEILALANTPAFDPNDRASARPERRRNRAITDFHEPGSTLKALLLGAALEHGVVRPEERIFCERGRFPVGRWVINDHHSHDWLSVKEILQVSSNIGAAKIGERLGRERFHAFLTAFELGRPTGVDLPGEVGGLMRPLGDWSRIALITTSFGQGIAATPLQMARAFAAIANGGLLMTPYVAKRASGPDGELLWEHHPTVVRRVMKPETARTLTAMLETVVEEGGTGTLARIEGVRVAGKTGTAQKIEAGTGRYGRGRIASFVGFLPAEAPRLVIFVLVDEPERSTFGGVVAAPIFREIALEAMKRLGFPATEPVLWQEAALGLPAGAPRGGTFGTSPSSETRMGLAPRPVGVAVVAEPAPGVPSFIGLSMRAALELARELGWTVEISGNGYVARQKPSPGASVSSVRSIWLDLVPASDVL